MRKLPAARPVTYWVVVAAVFFAAGSSRGEPVIKYVAPGGSPSKREISISPAKSAVATARKNTPSKSEAAIIQAIHSPTKQIESGVTQPKERAATAPADERRTTGVIRPAKETAPTVQMMPAAVRPRNAGVQLRAAAALIDTHLKTEPESVIKPAVAPPMHQRLAIPSVRPAKATAATVQLAPAPVTSQAANVQVQAAAALISTTLETESQPTIKRAVPPPQQAVQIARPAKVTPAVIQVTPAPISAHAASLQARAAAALINTRLETESEPSIEPAVAPPMPQHQALQIARPARVTPAIIQVTPAPITSHAANDQGRAADALISTHSGAELEPSIKPVSTTAERARKNSPQTVAVQVDANRMLSPVKIVLVQKSVLTRSVPRGALQATKPHEQKSVPPELSGPAPARVQESSRLAVQTATNVRTQIQLAPAPVSPLRSVQPPAPVIDLLDQKSQVADSPAPLTETMTRDEARIEVALFSPSRSLVSHAAVKPSLIPEKMNSELVEKIVGRPSLIAFVSRPPADIASPSHIGPIDGDYSTFARDDDESDAVGLRPIDRVTINVRPPEGELPPDHAGARFARDGELVQHMGASRQWMMFEVNWEASSLATRPVYFEDVNLERYGFSHGLLLEPFFSAAHFFVRVPIIPYMRGASPPRQPVYTLGYGRPGTYFPYYLHRPPFSVRGGLQQAAAVVGLVYILP